MIRNPQSLPPMNISTAAAPHAVEAPTPNPALAAQPYSRSVELRPIDLRLDANEGLSPPAAFLESCLLTALIAGQYPSAAALEALLALEHGVDPARVIVTAGADDAIERLCRVMAGPGRAAIMTDPTFEMIPRFVTLAGGRCIEVPWTRGEFPTKEIIQLASEDVGLICIVTPNNPTGLTAGADDLHLLRAAFPKAVLLVDLAYGEFADIDLTTPAASIPWTVVTRTFSKAWGLAGLRVGYAICDLRVAGWLRRAGLPYAAAGYSIQVAHTWRREGATAMNAYVTSVRSARERVRDALTAAGASVTESQANFVLARFRDAPLVADLLASLGVAVRRYAASPNPELQSSLRISIPIGANLERLLLAIKAIARPQALIFDMDGVLVDVGGSYREAIIQTCRLYEVEVTPRDIAAQTAAGNANNDWVLTQRLLAAAGVNVALQDITKTFEQLYQGNGTPGLRGTEQPLITSEQLRTLGGRFRLGIVTGRPRADADYFLNQQGWASYFGAVVCMEDGPLKPSPAPVKLCLARLGLAETAPAWMFGDTPDDIRAARAAGVVPIGVIPPGEDPSAREQMLLRAGAGRVLTRLSDLSMLSQLLERGL